MGSPASVCRTRQGRGACGEVTAPAPVQPLRGSDPLTPHVELRTAAAVISAKITQTSKRRVAPPRSHGWSQSHDGPFHPIPGRWPVWRVTQASERSEARLGGCRGGYTGCVRAGPGSPATSKGTSEPKRPLQNAAPRGQSSVAGLRTPPRQRAPGPGFSRRGAESRVRRSHLPRGSLSPATPAIAADEKLGQGMDSPGRGLRPSGRRAQASPRSERGLPAPCSLRLPVAPGGWAGDSVCGPGGTGCEQTQCARPSGGCAGSEARSGQGCWEPFTHRAAQATCQGPFLGLLQENTVSSLCFSLELVPCGQPAQVTASMPQSVPAVPASLRFRPTTSLPLSLPLSEPVRVGFPVTDRLLGSACPSVGPQGALSGPATWPCLLRLGRGAGPWDFRFSQALRAPLLPDTRSNHRCRVPSP